uniref:Phosphatidic acid phosphatase type 2/haloperoxidase domain-containing protein n=1 Tax=Musca domestica TaxID=7370 RepID=A0A1I8MGA6_MUSDO
MAYSRLLHSLSQTAVSANFLADSKMFSGSGTSLLNNHDDNDNQSATEDITTQNARSNLLKPHTQRHSNFDTYPPPKRAGHIRPPRQSVNNLEAPEQTMSMRNSPLRVTNTGRIYTKRLTPKRSYSESSADKQLHKYSTSDSSQEEDEMMLNSTDKRKMTRRSISNGLQYSHHKYRSSRHHNAEMGEENTALDGCAIFGEFSKQVSDWIDIAIRVLLVVVFSKLETQTAFKRVIHPEEMWMYKNPRTRDYVSPLSLLMAVIIGPLVVTAFHLMLTKDRRDFRAASWAWTLILGLNGLATSLLKISVGRPRPDFFYRCFPDGVMHLTSNITSNTDNMLDLFNCTGSITAINEGRKSFPSGHSSFAFAGFGFISYYVGAKLHAFNYRGRGQTWRLCIAIAPLVLATLVAVSRTCDYHHHWEDVTIGGAIGLFVSYYIYRQYYPSIFSPNCHRPLTRIVPQVKREIPESEKASTSACRPRRRLISYKRVPSDELSEATLMCKEQILDNGQFANDTSDKRPLINDPKTDNKWF